MKTAAVPDSRHGKGPYLKTKIANPKGLEDIPRAYSRYGILKDWFKQDLLLLPKPDLILVTSLMTYWYPGVFETIEILNEIYPDTSVVLGGIYATLYKDHAEKNSGANRVVTGAGEEQILKIVSEYTGFSTDMQFDPENMDTFPYPSFDLQRTIGYIPLVTSKGCPFSCAYCASNILNPTPMRRNPEAVVKEIVYWHKKYSVKDFAFYDDALLVGSKNHAIPILEMIIKTGLDLRFHTPNALHIREISKKVAKLMFKAGFITIRLGLETANFDKRDEMDEKVTADEFTHAVFNLLESGFEKKQIGAYLLAGLPDQATASIKSSIVRVKKTGITPVLAYYTPIPHTALWEKAVSSSRYDLESDPVFSNNAIFPCQKEDFSWEKISYLKNLC